MKLELKRTALRDTYTIGNLYVNGEFFCNTLEDKVRDVKIKGVTAIPYGEYKVILSMSNRFKKVMPLLLNVPNYEGVRIHSGSTSADTSGCVLVGDNTAKGFVSNSRNTFIKLMNILTKTKEPIVLTIK